MHRTFDGEKLDVAALREVMGPGASLSINTIRKPDLKRLQGLDELPLDTLSLRWLSSTDLTTVPLPPTLKELRIWHSRRLVSLDGIEAAPALECVELRGNGPLQNANGLHALKHLREFAVEGDPPSLQKIETLDFLNGLPITTLTLRAVEGKTLNLDPVAGLSALKTLDLHGPNFAPAELAKVAAAHGWFYEALMDLPDAPSFVPLCTKCTGPKKTLFLAGKKGHWCVSCEAAGLEKALAEFRDLVEAARG